MKNKNLWGEEISDKKNLADYFIIPPFSILNASSKKWQQRKKIWMHRINDKAQARSNKLRVCGDIFAGHSYDQAVKFMSIKGDTTSILDPVLSEVLLHWFSEENHNVFDPFAGDAVFGYVSAYKNRLFEGIELRQEQVKFNQTLIDELNTNSKYICDDALNIKNHFENESKDFMFTCPPYADLEVYSDLENDLSTMTYEQFFETIEKVLIDCYSILKYNRFACIVIGEVRNRTTGCYIGLVPNIIGIMERAGFYYYNEIILQTPIGNLQMRAGTYMNQNRKVGKQHQNVLVFYKGNPKNISKHFNKLKYGSENME
jgi:DNA modification methylase